MRLAQAVALVFLATALACAQVPTMTDLDAREMNELGQAVSEAGSSPIDTIRALERHLKKYPATRQRAVIEKALAKAAMDSNDTARIILYGEKALAAAPASGASATPAPDDMQLLDRVTRALEESGDKEQAKRAIGYALRYEKNIVGFRRQDPPGHSTRGQWNEDLDRAMARVLALRARATGATGDQEAAAKLAMDSWAAWPTGEGAREAGYWLTSLGRTAEAIEFYANAFTVEDPRTTDADRARDRTRMGALYTKIAGSEKGLGDTILQAYDRTTAMLSEKRAGLKQLDPNTQAVDVLDFTLPAPDGTSLRLASLKGKILVIDFWATWCVPCRAQHPMLENVQKHFGNTPDIVFLAVDTDEDRSLVTPFLKDAGWDARVYYEAGLATKLTISSIPTVLVVNPAGQIASRMAGFIPERFEDMLTQRIEEARASVPPSK